MSLKTFLIRFNFTVLCFSFNFWQRLSVIAYDSLTKGPSHIRGPFPSASTGPFPHSRQLPTRSCYPCSTLLFVSLLFWICAVCPCANAFSNDFVHIIPSCGSFWTVWSLYGDERNERTKQKLRLTKSIHIHNGALAGHRFVHSSNRIYFIHFF